MNTDLYLFTKFPKESEEPKVAYIVAACFLIGVLSLVLKTDLGTNKIFAMLDAGLIILMFLSISMTLLTHYRDKKYREEFYKVADYHKDNYKDAVKDFCEYIQEYFDKFKDQDIILTVSVFKDKVTITGKNDLYVIKYIDKGFETLTCVETYIVALLIKKRLSCGSITFDNNNLSVDFDKRIVPERNLRPWNRTYLHD